MSYQCGFCRKDYSSLNRLEKHKCSFCQLCQRSYSSKQKYDSHRCVRRNAREVLNVSYEESSVSNHVCSACKKGFSSVNYLAAHKCPYCPECNHIFASYQKYEMHRKKCSRLHNQTDDDDEPMVSLPLLPPPTPEPTSSPIITDYKCELCRKYFSSPKYLATHKCAYCKPCKRSFATFQKFRMHKIKCMRISLDDSNLESDTAADDSFESNSIGDMVAARGTLVTREIIRRIATLELLRRNAGLSTINDLMMHLGAAKRNESDQSEDLVKEEIAEHLNNPEEESLRNLSGESTNNLLSRLSVSDRSFENLQESQEGNLDDEKRLTSDKNFESQCDGFSSDVSDKRKLEGSVSADIEVMRRMESHSKGTRGYGSESCLNSDSEHLDNEISVKSECIEPLVESQEGNERTINSPLIEKGKDYLLNSDDRLHNIPFDKAQSENLDLDNSVKNRLSPDYASELLRERLEVPSETLPFQLPQSPKTHENVSFDSNNPATFHQNIMAAQLIAAIRSRILLSSTSHKPTHFLDDCQENSTNQNTECKSSKMPRAKLIDSKPRGRMTAYAFFVQTCREEHKKKHPDENVIFSEFSRKCADRWKTMTNKEKLRFHEMAEKDKDRYENEMKGYRGPRTPRGSRKRRHRKDPNAPKRALSAFFWFSSDERPKVRAANPDMGVGDIAKQLGAAWGVTPPEVKSKYEVMAENDRARYEREMKAYKEGNFAIKKQKVEVQENDDDEDESESEEEEEEDDDDEEVE